MHAPGKPDLIKSCPTHMCPTIVSPLPMIPALLLFVCRLAITALRRVPLGPDRNFLRHLRAILREWDELGTASVSALNTYSVTYPEVKGPRTRLVCISAVAQEP